MALRSDLQQVAKDALGDREGSVVVIEPATGAVRAMWSFPTYDPNLIANPDFDAATRRDHVPRGLPGRSAARQRLPAALHAGLDVQDPDDGHRPGERRRRPRLDVPRRERVRAAADERPDPELRGHHVRRRPHRGVHAQLQHPLRQDRPRPSASTAWSTASPTWGVGERVPIDLPRPAASTFGPTDDLDQNLPLLAIRGFGQNEVQMVPLHMAMVAGDGRQRRADDEAVRRRADARPRRAACSTGTEPEVWKTPISPATADIMTDLMVSVAESGTASCCIALEGGIPVAAKTGTAQLNSPGEPERSHAWIVAFAPADAPRYAVAVTILGHQRGDLGQHRRPPRRPGRQDRPRRRARGGAGLMSPRAP